MHLEGLANIILRIYYYNIQKWREEIQREKINRNSLSYFNSMATETVVICDIHQPYFVK